MEEEVSIILEDISLEGLYHDSLDKRAAIIAHPHPLYGGNMHNNVVLTLRDAFLDQGLSTLRFNFRGVGRSQGSFGDGLGEQDDLRAGIHYLLEKGYQEIYLAGYSFGAYVALRGLDSYPDIKGLVLVSLPLGLWEAPRPKVLPKSILLVTGEADEIAPSGLLKELADTWGGTSLVIIPGSDHFYWGAELRLYEALKTWISSV